MKYNKMDLLIILDNKDLELKKELFKKRKTWETGKFLLKK